MSRRRLTPSDPHERIREIIAEVLYPTLETGCDHDDVPGAAANALLEEFPALADGAQFALTNGGMIFPMRTLDEALRKRQPGDRVLRRDLPTWKETEL